MSEIPDIRSVVRLIDTHIPFRALNIRREKEDAQRQMISAAKGRREQSEMKDSNPP